MTPRHSRKQHKVPRRHRDRRTDPALWSAEHPNLYTLVLTLYNSETKESYSIISQQLGFREIGFTSTVWDYEAGENKTGEYDTVKINGVPMYIKGVNRHDRVPTTGKYVSHDVYETDISCEAVHINTIAHPYSTTNICILG
jgi:beta-galactosidase